jgi:hypothetical protein
MPGQVLLQLRCEQPNTIQPVLRRFALFQPSFRRLRLLLQRELCLERVIFATATATAAKYEKVAAAAAPTKYKKVTPAATASATEVTSASFHVAQSGLLGAGQWRQL